MNGQYTAFSGKTVPAGKIASLMALVVLTLALAAAAVSCARTEGPGKIDPENTAPAVTDNPTEAPSEEPEDPYENKVRPSVSGGYYDEAFLLELTAPEGFEKIYYTDDGTVPTEGSALYTEPITVKLNHRVSPGPVTRDIGKLMGLAVPSSRTAGCTVIRAIAVDAEGNRTPITTESYFVWPETTAQYNCPVISLSVKLEDFATAEGLYYITMQHPFDTKPRAPAYCEVYDETGALQGSQWIEISLAGNGSLGNQQKSIRLYFKSDAEGMDEALTEADNPGKLKYDVFRGEAKNAAGEALTSYKRLVLRNAGNEAVGSFMADRVSQKVASLLNVDYQEARTTVVFINGELWGMYNLRERFGAKYFEAHYGLLEEHFAMLEAPTPLVTGNSYSPYDLQDGTEQDKADWEALVKFVKGSNMAKSENYAKAEEQLDMLSLIDVMIAHMYVCNGDFPWNNVKVWRCSSKNDPSRLDTRWRFVVMDMDGGLISDYNSNMFNHALNTNTILGAMTVSLLKNEEFKALFIERCMYAANEVFTEERIIREIDRTVAEMESAVKANVARWGKAGFSLQTWNSKVAYMRTFAANRRAVWLSQLYAYFGINPTSLNVSFDENAVNIKINGQTVKSGTRVDLGMSNESSTFDYEISAKSGYSLDCILLTYPGSKKQEEVTASRGSVTVSGNLDLCVNMKKKGVETRTEMKVAAGGDSVYYLSTEGVLYGWGGNASGQLGLSSQTYTVPKKLLTGVKNVWTAQGGSTGNVNFTFVLMADGRLLSAGNNASGQLGRTGSSGSFGEVAVPDGKQPAMLSLGYDHTLLLTADGVLYGVGNNAYSQLGDTGAASTSHWVKLAVNVISCAAGRRHTLYVTSDGSLYALGDNRWNKLSSSAPEVISVPFKLASDAREAICGEHSALYIDRGNVLYYLGTRATMIAGGKVGSANKLMDNVRSATMQEGHVLIVTLSGDLYGWGENANGQTLKGSTEAQTAPVLIAASVKGAAAGAGFSVFIENDGTVVVRGANASGQAGKGAISARVSEARLIIN